MFVSVAIDAGSKETANALALELSRLGFEKVQRALWENAKLNTESLDTLKKAIDRVTDSYDVVRLYQYPIDDMLVITQLSSKKWRRLAIKKDAL